MKEQKLIEMRNKLDKLDQIMQQVIQEMYNLKNLSVGTLETIKRMSEYDKLWKNSRRILRKKSNQKIN